MQQFITMLNESIYDADFKKFFTGVNFSKTNKSKKEMPRSYDMHIHITDVYVDVHEEGKEDADKKQVETIFKKYKFPLNEGDQYSYGTVNTIYEFMNDKDVSVTADYYHDSKSNKTLIMSRRNRTTEYFLV